MKAPAVVALAALALAQSGCIIVVEEEYPRAVASLPAERDDHRPRMGVYLEDVDDALAAQLGVDDDNATLIRSVVAGGPADRAGLEDYDVITRVEGATGASVEEVRAAIRGHDKGETMRVLVLRRGQQRKFTVRLE